MVRDRARKSGDDPTVLPKITERDKAKLREIIWNERRIELAMEGHRFFDLIRADKVVSRICRKDAEGPWKDKLQYEPSIPHSTFHRSRFDISQGILKQNK